MTQSHCRKCRKCDKNLILDAVFNVKTKTCSQILIIIRLSDNIY